MRNSLPAGRVHVTVAHGRVFRSSTLWLRSCTRHGVEFYSATQNNSFAIDSNTDQQSGPGTFTAQPAQINAYRKRRINSPSDTSQQIMKDEWCNLAYTGKW